MLSWLRQKDKKRLISEVVVLSVIFGLAGGVVGQIFADAYLRPWLGVSVEDPSATVVSVPELKRTKRFLGIEQDFEVDKALQQNARTVVGLYVKRSGETALQQIYTTQNLLGSAVALTSDGWLITKSLVIGNRDPETIVAVYQNNAYPVTAVVTDSLTGTTFVKVSVDDLSVIILGDSDENMSGQLAVALNALGEATVTTIAKPKFRLQETSSSFGLSTEAYYETILLSVNDLPATYIGAPLLNLAGEVTGIIGAIDAERHQVRVTPINQFRSLILSVIKNGQIVRPYLGVTYIDISNAPGLDISLTQGRQFGSLVYQAPAKNSPAAVSGLTVDDIITAVDGQPIDAENQLTKLIQQYQPGETVSLSVLRDGQSITIKPTLGTLSE